MSYYDPDGMKPEAKEKFEEWYEEQQGCKFDLQKELEAYCKSIFRGPDAERKSTLRGAPPSLGLWSFSRKAVRSSRNSSSKKQTSIRLSVAPRLPPPVISIGGGPSRKEWMLHAHQSNQELRRRKYVGSSLEFTSHPRALSRELPTGDD